MNATTVVFFGGPHDGRSVSVGTVRPVVYLPNDRNHTEVYTRLQGTEKAVYQLIDGVYVFAGVKQPGTMGKP